MVQCACGKIMDKIPAWLESVTVEFVCNNCPKRQMKRITQVQLETPERASGTIPAVDEFAEEDDEIEEE